MTESQQIVIVGGGLAAAHAITTLREEGYDGAITLVAAEDHLPYERPPLSKSYLSGTKTFADALVHDQAWYDEHHVRVLTGTTATGIDLAARTVTVDPAPPLGDPLSYDALLLATGAEPKVPDLPGAGAAAYLRTVEDADALKEAFRAGGRVVLVGGGWIGLELAAAARQAGMEVTVLEAAPLPLAGVLGEEMAQYLTDLHRGHGVDIRTGVTVEAIETVDGHPQLAPTGVRTSDGTFDADLVVVAVGAAPRTSLAEEAGLGVATREDGGGITVDQQLRATDPHVWAAGDAALAVNTVLGPLRVEHWDNAIRQGKAAAKSILGQEVAYDWLPYFYTDQFDFGMEYVGHGSASDTVEVRGSLADGEFIAYWLDDENRVTAAMNVNIWDVSDRLREIVGTTVDPGTLTDLR
ncbi:NAD(P)/FAD-dependent oxidoreductase [Nocardioides sp. GY 10113]|uniref:NAD(P)/FAD-dependent oxidoreductase n=1 Tax=Nocardioides sp. GY 10113 TaxID=2569761 RepID=UPI0010A856D3|nr:FAD/NAD(P)-binding oxidoreductase [Nocardioides sp. GY 10113]TIC89070.1 NAD(P)/FAD-dependent oxidoreductase [Nocardioides sp. GY 10113]